MPKVGTISLSSEEQCIAVIQVEVVSSEDRFTSAVRKRGNPE
jgi:hypothetical protein